MIFAAIESRGKPSVQPGRVGAVLEDTDGRIGKRRWRLARRGFLDSVE